MKLVVLFSSESSDKEEKIQGCRIFIY